MKAMASIHNLELSDIVTESGPPHQKQYQATVEVSNGMTATGELEKTKKEAEISAAQKLLDKFKPALGSKERYDSQITQTEERLEKLLLDKPSHPDEQQEQIYIRSAYTCTFSALVKCLFQDKKIAINRVTYILL